MLRVNDMISTLVLIFFLGLALVMIEGLSKQPAVQRMLSNDAISCGVDNPCAVGLKCINGFCAKTERLRMYERDLENEAESYPGTAAPFLGPK